MAKFMKGLMVGVGIGLFVAPVPGQEMRRLLGQRLRQLFAYNPGVPATPAQVSSGPSSVDPDFQPVQGKSATRPQEGTMPSASVSPSRQEDRQQGTAKQQSSLAAPRTQSSSSAVPVSSVSSAPARSAPENVAAKGASENAAAKNMPENAPAKNAPEKNAATETVLVPHDRLDSLPGMNADLQHALNAEGIVTRQQLLGYEPKEKCVELAQKIGMPARTLRGLITAADLLRLPGAKRETVMLLEKAGVTSCQDLQQRNPEHLHAKLVEVQTKQGRTTNPIDLEQVTGLIAAAMNVAGPTTQP